MLNLLINIVKNIEKYNINTHLYFLKNKYKNNNNTIINNYNCIFSNTNTKQSFTIVELAIVIVIVCLLLSILIMSRSLVNLARVNKIFEEYRMYNIAIQTFYDRYSCMPGDCNSLQITDISSSISAICLAPVTAANAIANTTNTEIYNTVGGSLIESTTKRTCMFQELQAGSFIADKKVNLSYSIGTYPLTDSIAGQTIPSAAFNKGAAWDFRVVYADGSGSVTGRYTAPDEIGFVNSKTANWVGNHMLILRDANLSTGLSFDSSFTSWSGGPQYAVSSNLAGRIDTKFDDGLPYAGNIAGALTASDLSGPSPAISWLNNNVGGNLTAPACSNTAGSGTVWNNALIANAMNSSTSYLSSNNVSKGCLVVFLIPIVM